MNSRPHPNPVDSQARHEMGAQNWTCASRNVVPQGEGFHDFRFVRMSRRWIRAALSCLSGGERRRLPLPMGEGRGEGPRWIPHHAKQLCVSLLLFVVTGFLQAFAQTADKPVLIVVVGAAGEEEYGSNFVHSSELWVQAGKSGGADVTVIGTDPTNATTDFDRLKQTLAAEPKESVEALWLVLLGHGTFDGKVAKFNLRGPDISAEDLAAWLQPFKRPLAVIDCSSSSAPFLPKLSATGRVIITATRSGYEQNYARFGENISEAIVDPASDLDKDGQVSLLEAYLVASRRVAEFYKSQGRLMTEHALLDDNGDGLGTPADWFQGIRAVKRARNGAALDGTRANQFVLVRSAQEQKIPPALRARRDELELAVEKLRDQKATLAEDEYYRQLEPIMVELAKIATQAGQ